LKVPLHISVLQSREINAFALPGGYLFIQRGLIEAADNESELAGVLVHEMAHDTARHSNKLMNRATIASLFYQAAQVAAIILTRGAAGIGLAYALQYGFYGLGLVINLKLLGVSRDYEVPLGPFRSIETFASPLHCAPSSQVSLIAETPNTRVSANRGAFRLARCRRAKVARSRSTRRAICLERRVRSVRLHPILRQDGHPGRLRQQRELVPHSPSVLREDGGRRAGNHVPASEAKLHHANHRFRRNEEGTGPIAAKAEKEETGKPSLLVTREEGCEPPKKLEYKPGQPIEQICASPAVTVAGAKQVD
jgi:Peptidase family M48